LFESVLHEGVESYYIGGKLVCKAYFNRESCGIGSFWLPDEVRGKGVGTSILNDIIEKTLEKGLHRIQLGVVAADSKTFKTSRPLAAWYCKTFSKFGFKSTLKVTYRHYFDTDKGVDCSPHYCLCATKKES
jgi:GNAT superfamily N-acetyltransferase